MPVEVSSAAEGIALVRLLGQSASNAFNPDSISELADAIRVGLDDEDIRGFVLTGSGGFFCAGADINEFRQHIDAGSIGIMIRQMTDILHPLILDIRSSATVMIAAVNGAAAGAGLGLALAADQRIASPSAKFAASYFGLGLSPDGGTSWLLPRLVGAQVTRRFFFDNEVWDAAACLSHGAVDAVVEEESLLDSALDAAISWGRWARVSRASKDLLDHQEHADLATHLKLEQRRIIDAGFEPTFSEGVDSFLEKRSAEFNREGFK